MTATSTKLHRGRVDINILLDLVNTRFACGGDASNISQEANTAGVAGTTDTARKVRRGPPLKQEKNDNEAKKKKQVTYSENDLYQPSSSKRTEKRNCNMPVKRDEGSLLRETARQILSELDTIENNIRQRKQKKLKKQQQQLTTGGKSPQDHHQNHVRFKENQETIYYDMPSKEESRQNWYKKSDFKDFRHKNRQIAKDIRLQMNDKDSDECLRGLEHYRTDGNEDQSGPSWVTTSKQAYIQNVLMLQMNQNIRKDPEKFATLASTQSRRDRLMAKRRASQDEKDAFELYNQSHVIRLKEGQEEKNGQQQQIIKHY